MDENRKNSLEKVDKIVAHIQNVQKNCLTLGRELIERGDVVVGRQLIANGFLHDNSKLSGVEWDNLNYFGDEAKDNELKLKLAVSHHHNTNSHHPEYWNGIKNMPTVYVAEMVCDWYARASEFGASVHDWIHDEAMKRYKFTKKDKVYKQINYYLGWLITPPF